MADPFIRFTCDICGKKLKAHVSDAGKRTHCVCGRSCTVPDYYDVEIQELNEARLLPAIREPVIPEATPAPVDDNPFQQLDLSTKDYRHVELPRKGMSIGEVVACCLLVPLIGLLTWFVATTVFNVPDMGIVLLVLAAVIAVFCLLSWLIGLMIGKTWYQVLGYIMIGIAGVFLIGGIIAGSRGGRPLNYCGNCGHTWYPRGSWYSVRCPSCGVVRRLQ